MKNKEPFNGKSNEINPSAKPLPQSTPYPDCSSMIDSLPDALFRITLPSGACNYFNAATSRLFDGPPQNNEGNELFIRQHIPSRYLDEFDAAWQSRINGTTQEPIEYPITAKDRSIHWIRQHVRVVRDENERAVAADCIATDISGQIKSSSEIAALRKFPSENPNPVLQISLEGVISYFNEASRIIIDHWEYTEGTKVKKHWQQLVERVLADGRERTVEIRIQDRIFSLTFTPVADSSFVNAYGMDITDQKQAFAEIDKLTKFPSENPNPVLRMDNNGNVLFANKASCSLLDFWNIRPGSRINETWQLLIRDILDEGVVREMELQIDDTWFSLSFAPVLTKNFVNIYGLDITARKKIELNLKYANNSLSAFRDIATLKNSDLTTICDTTLNAIIRITRSRMGMFGFLNSDESELSIKSLFLPQIPENILKSMPDTLPVEDLNILSESIKYRRAIIKNDRNTIDTTSEIIPQEFLKIRRFVAIPIFSENSIIAIAGVANREDNYTDVDIVHVNALCESVMAIVERIRAENALRENTVRYSASFQDARDAILIFSTSRNVVDANNALFKLSGWSRDELHALTLRKLFPDADPHMARKRLMALSRGETIPVFEEQMYTKSGDTIPVEIAIAFMRDCYGYDIVFQAIIRDITERKKAEEAIGNSQRLESLGVLAGGIAHDFNNLLSGIFGNLDLALDSIDDKTQTVSYLEKSMSALSRAKGLTQQLLTFSRGGAPCKSSISLESLIRESSSITMSGSSIKCSIDICDDLYNIDADSGQISQVLNNLLLNARQAMPEGGELKVATRRLPDDGQLELDAHPIQIGQCIGQCQESIGQQLFEASRFDLDAKVGRMLDEPVDHQRIH